MPLSPEALINCENILNKVAMEMALPQPGNDEGLIPIYSLLADLADAGSDDDTFWKSIANVRKMLDGMLDEARPFDSNTITYLTNFTDWAQIALNSVSQKRDFDLFGPIQEVMDKSDGADSEKTGAGGEDDLAAKTDVLLEFDLKEDEELLAEFHTEAMDHLDQIEACVLTLEGAPTNKESLNEIFRSFHTLKGVAGFLHLTPIQSLAHEVESLLDLARNGKLILTSPMITLILESRDIIQTLIGQISTVLNDGTAPTEVIPVSGLIIKFKEAAQQLNGQEEPPEKIEEKGFFDKSPAPAPVSAETKKTGNGSTTGNGGKKAAGRTGGGLGSDRATIRVNTIKLDNLMDTVGELVIVQSQLDEASKRENRENSPLRGNLGQLLRITKDLQHTSMALRMVPIKPTFQKIGRLVRDLSRNSDKKVSFHVSGEDTELDRNVVEQIGDPLIHMVRNAIDHGLESPSERIAAGKDETGNVHLKAYHLGSNIVIELSDDGAGLDHKKIISKARSQGLAAKGENPSTRDIYQYIFLPGFSTAKKITDISGRGVGMDVVRRNVEALRGIVEVDSQPGKGSTFKIKLPLTMAIIDGLVVKVGDDKFILPTTSVKVALRPTRKQISMIKGTVEILDLRGRSIPIVHLHEVFHIPSMTENAWEGIVVIIESFGKCYGLLVDEMVAKQEVVIKSLGNFLQGIYGVSGGAILGDGTIALILDPTAFLKNKF